MAKLLFNKTKKSDELKARRKKSLAYAAALTFSIVINLALAVYIWQM